MYPLQAFPALHAEHLMNAKLYATREQMVAELARHQPDNPAVCEVGVALGGFSKFIFDNLRPSVFYAVDLFRLHYEKVLWGQSTSEIFVGQTHRQYYEGRFSRATILEGPSADCLATLPDQSLDIIYIDAGHDYADVKADGEQALQKIRPSGLLVFNDYTMADHWHGSPYGVVQAVNEIVVGSDWRVVGFALQHHMFCDIALRRA